ncbi:hypothetical protein E3N88_19598 [Mikania micrantha]|uniref:Uncharacterized protein n=1 Tax=Mikania micrantha TaxID=192012 RepID=A0A5N6NNN4_9ASTR|nr:hypothetical protein E3N88_19598 [Mikania micrantha]
MKSLVMDFSISLSTGSVQIDGMRGLRKVEIDRLQESGICADRRPLCLWLELEALKVENGDWRAAGRTHNIFEGMTDEVDRIRA